MKQIKIQKVDTGRGMQGLETKVVLSFTRMRGICFHPKSYVLCELKPHAIFQKLKVSVVEQRRRRTIETKLSLIVDT